MKKTYIIIGLLLSFCSLEAKTQAGSFDATFGTAGIAKTDVTGTADEGFAIAQQSDGKIVAAGYTTSTTGSGQDFVVMRYKTNGTLDSSFGTYGIVITAITGGDDIARSVLIQPDGKIVVTGFTRTGSDGDFALVRYLANGTLDASFGTAGIVTTSVSTGVDVSWSSALQSDGKIVMCGAIPNGTGGDFGVARYTTAGVLDPSFGIGGISVFADTIGDIATVLKIQPDGKILVCGYSGNAGYDFSVIRLLATGNPDLSFGTGGKVQIPVGTMEDIALGMAIQPDGKIIVSGYAWNSAMTKTDFAMIRLSATGVLDAGFGTGGLVISPIIAGSTYARGLALQPDGKILLTGQAVPTPGSSDFVIARYTSAGVLDASFNGTGFNVTDVAGGDNFDVAYMPIMQPDGKILVCGTALHSPTALQIDLVVARYLSGLTLGVAAPQTGNDKLLVYPNPMTTQGIAEYSLDEARPVSVFVTDMLGRKVMQVFEGQQQAGSHRQNFTLPAILAPGTYLLVLSAGGNTEQVQITKQ